MSRLFTGPRLFAAHSNTIVAQVESRQGESLRGSSAQKRDEVVEDLCRSAGYIHNNVAAMMMQDTLRDCAGSVSPSDVYLPVQGKRMSCGDLADAHEELNYQRQLGDERIQLANRHTGQGWETTQRIMIDISELVKEFNRCADLNYDIFVPGFEVDGDYEPKMAESVKELQWRLGFVGDVVDGNFGPGTRAQLDKDFFIDVGSIPSGPGCDVWYIGPGGDEPVFWSAISNPVTGLSQPTA
ncbi:hypothetical protein HYT52_04900 [Candidatus Woesearchaeota archaeon]|nr:hypothetical protein [Candidatus Woesearchaeota archaeon]